MCFAQEQCLYAFHLLILICLFSRGYWKQYSRDLIQQTLIHQIRARALCTTLASALERAPFENLGSQHHVLHGGVTIPTLWCGPPHDEPELYVVRSS